MHDNRPLTVRQRLVFDAIVAHVAANGCPPSIRELCEAIGVSSPNGVIGHLKSLEKYGYIERPAGHLSRSIKLLVRNGCCPTCGSRVRRETGKPNGTAVAQPTAGRLQPQASLRSSAWERRHNAVGDNGSRLAGAKR